MGTFLEVKGKLGPIPQSSSSQYRPPWPDTNPIVRKVNKAAEKRKRVVPTKKFRANVSTKSNEAATCQPVAVFKTSTERTPDNRPPPLEDAPICKSTPWPKAGKISGNLSEERKDWLLPPNYLDNNTRDTTNVTSPKPPIKGEPKLKSNHLPVLKQKSVDGDQIAPSAKIKKKKTGMVTTRSSCSSNCSPNRRFR